MKVGLHALNRPIHDTIENKITDEVEMMQRLANLAMECNIMDKISLEDNMILLMKMNYLMVSYTTRMIQIILRWSLM